MSIVEKCGVRIRLPHGWVDGSSDAGNLDRLLTITKPDGIGAFQVSCGQYVSGKLPNVRLENLRELLAEFAASRRLGPEESPASGGRGDTIWCRSDYYRDGDFIRVWYITNSRSVGMATYVCDRHHKDIELNDCDLMIESIRLRSA